MQLCCCVYSVRFCGWCAVRCWSDPAVGVEYAVGILGDFRGFRGICREYASFGGF